VHEQPADGRLVSVVIPARNEAPGIRRIVRAVLRQHVPGVAIEVIVVDDGSTDGTSEVAFRAGARVVQVTRSPGNPGAARNLGARAAKGGTIVFLDADCVPSTGWLGALLYAHDEGAAAVGGSIEAAPDQGLAARCNHYCGSYHVHSGRARGGVPNHPPANLSVRRTAFLSTAGFTERLPAADGHEELAWQDELRRAGHSIVFEPTAVVWHRNRRGWMDLLRRNYRWAYSAISSKAGSSAVRHGWIYRHPIALIVSAPVLAVGFAFYTAVCWARAGILEPLALLPAVLLARIAYAAGLMVGGMRWWLQPGVERRPLGGRWR
jgi:glycosyltransferase involved in cell wall biosynthesis